MNIKVIGASKIFKNAVTGDFKACNNISIDINQGDFISLVGHTGSGKSTLISMIGSILKSSSGSIYYDAHKIENEREETLTIFRRDYFSFIFQYPVVIPTISLLDNILMPLVFKSGVTKEKIDEAKEYIRLFGLEDKSSLAAQKLSGGEMKKTAILRALTYGCDILIADEPTSDLDPATTKILMEVFHALNKKGVTIIMVTHAHDIAAHARSVYEMAHGQIIRCLK